MTRFHGRELRDTMSQFCTGVVIVTGTHEGALAGFAAQTIVSLSLEPPLIAVCPRKASTSWPKIRKTGHFCINVLGNDQRAVADAFARRGEVADIGWRPGVSGSPVLEGVLAYVDCALDAEHDAGDHTIAVGRVLDIEILDNGRGPLLFFRGGYGQFSKGHHQ